jgi:capsular exopolysaccharide synthesis family protein
MAPAARRAAAMANAAANATIAITNLRVRSQFAREAQELQTHLASLPRSGSGSSVRGKDEANLSRLQTLAVVAQPASVAQPADVPTSASSHHVAFGLVLGGVLGLILALAVAAVRELFDRTVHAPTDIAERLGLPVLGHVEEETLGTVPFLSLSPSSGELAAIARFGVLRKGVELLDEADPPRTVLVTSGGAAAGKTTVAVSLAQSFASVGRRVVLIECDLRRPVIAERLGINHSPGLAEYLRGEVELEQVLHDVDGPGAAGLRCIVAGTPTVEAPRLLASDALSGMLSELRRSADVIVIDTAPMIAVPDALELVGTADAVLLCVRAGTTSLSELDAAREVIERLPRRPGGVVVTGVSKERYELGGYADAYAASVAVPSSDR